MAAEAQDDTAALDADACGATGIRADGEGGADVFELAIGQDDEQTPVVERERASRPAGTGMYLPGNAARVLRACGLEAQVASRVVAIPHQVFYDDVEAGRRLVRFAFCKRPEVLTEAVNRLRALTPAH